MNINKFTSLAFVILICLIVIPVNRFAETKGTKKLAKTLGLPNRTYLNINSIQTQIYNNGNSDIDPSGNSGLIYPKGSNKGAVFESGLIWGCKIGNDPQPRVGGSTYSQGLQPGKIISPGVPEDPDLDKNRIYRVRRDIIPESGPRTESYRAGDVTSEIRAGEGDFASIIAQYEKDWMEWPVADGAPFEDLDNNGVWDPAKDIPGVPGADQTIWFVANDLNPTLTQNLYGATPIGIEMQATMWAYAQQGALGNMFFRKYTLINKSTQNYDSMYVSMWSDVDLGNSTDDFAGCDTSLSLGFTYNANTVDATYSPLPPPAVGFDFFQGPIVAGAPTDRAIFKNGFINGKKNLPMTAFFYFARGDATVTDPTLQDISGSTQFYNFMQGRIGLTGDFFVNPITNKPTTFALTGDPVTKTGWIDGQILGPGDRRMGLASGPFQMAPNDTQEVVVAEIVAGAITGVDRLSAINLLKYFDKQAQNAYDNFFNLTPPPSAPLVRATELNQQIVLNWGWDSSSVKSTENYNLKSYTFEGYNIYQLPSESATIDQAVRIANFDLINGITTIYDRFFNAQYGGFIDAPVQYGNDIGIQRFLNITNDALHGGTQLVNGTRYYFAVTAYGKSNLPVDTTFALAIPQVLENTLRIMTVTPHSTDPQVNPRALFGTSIAPAAHASGFSSAQVWTKVVDPYNIQGTDFKIDIVATDSVTIYLGDDGDPATYDSLKVPNPKWTLTNLTNNKIIYGPSTNFDSLSSSPIFDGVQVNLVGAPFYTPNKEIGAQTYEPEGNMNWEGINWGGITFGGGLDLASRLIGSTLLPYQVIKSVEVRFNSADGQNAYGFIRGDGGSSSATYTGFHPQPFKVFDVTDPNNPRQIDFAFMEKTGRSTANNIWAPGADEGGADREYFVFIDEDYTSTEKPEYANSTFGAAMGSKPTLYAGWYILSDPTLPPYQDGDVWSIKATVPPTAQDSWTFSTKGLSVTAQTPEGAREEVKKINVFPNPYYGVNSQELNKYNRFVTFNHLPSKAIIRIFNLAGVLVKTYKKDSESQFQRWDLANESGLPVASGLYLAYIEMPDLGETKIVKLAIIQEQQILDRF